MSIAENLSRILERIEVAAARAGRRAEDVTVVAVSKTFGVADIREAMSAGQVHFGENRIQEAAPKIEEIGAEVTWHLVGHLQTNKAGKAVALFDMIHSIDSLRLAEAVDKSAARADKMMPVLVEVNTSGERSKFGVRPEEVNPLLESLAGMQHLHIQGLMTIGSFVSDESVIRQDFRRLAGLLRDAQELRLPNAEMRHLSMGMTNDFEIAVEEGATMIRAGRAIFGARK